MRALLGPAWRRGLRLGVALEGARWCQAWLLVKATEGLNGGGDAAAPRPAGPAAPSAAHAASALPWCT